jgi:hypothetical protein
LLVCNDRLSNRDGWHAGPSEIEHRQSSEVRVNCSTDGRTIEALSLLRECHVLTPADHSITRLFTKRSIPTNCCVSVGQLHAVERMPDHQNLVVMPPGKLIVMSSDHL